MLDRTENEAIGEDTLSLSLAELKGLKKTLEKFRLSSDFDVRVEAECLLRMVDQKLERLK